MLDCLDTEGKYLTEFQRQHLQKNLENQNLSPQHRQRILIMLLADSGKTQTEICQELKCSQATARNWILMAQSGMAHHWKKRGVGRPQTVSEEYLTRLQELVDRSPRDFGYAFSRWTGNWLSQHLAKELGIKVSDRYINQLLKKMGLPTKINLLKQTTGKLQLESSRIEIQDLPIISSWEDLDR
jgi:transposase